MLFVGTSIIHPSTEGVFLLCNILDLLIYRLEIIKRDPDKAKFLVNRHDNNTFDRAANHPAVFYVTCYCRLPVRQQ